MIARCSRHLCRKFHCRKFKQKLSTKTKGDAIMFDLKGGTISLRLAGFGVLALFAISGGAVYSQAVAPTNSLPNPYVGAPFGKLPEGRNWGSTAGIAVDPDGKSIWVAERCGAFAPPSQ